MPVSDLAIYSRAQATGVLASALFVGGNIVISFVFLPCLKRVSSPLERISAWSLQYDIAAKLMPSLGVISSIAFGTAAYYAPTIGLRNSMIASAAFGISVIPFTGVAILPTVHALKEIEAHKDVAVAEAEGDDLISKWGKLSLARWLLVSVGCLNGLKELSEWYTM